VRSYFDQPGASRSSPAFFPFSDNSYWPRPQMFTSARLSPGFTVNSRRSSSVSKFVTGAEIHFARQSESARTPTVHVAGWLHAETFPPASQARTFQKTCCVDLSSLPL